MSWAAVANVAKSGIVHLLRMSPTLLNKIPAQSKTTAPCAVAIDLYSPCVPPSYVA